MVFQTDIFEGVQPPCSPKYNLIGVKLPTNQDVYFMSKWHELFERYEMARVFLYKTGGENWDYWFNRLDDETALQDWIRDTFNPIKTYNIKHSAYSLKHLLESKTGIYLTNNQMKDALLNMGYICQNEHKINWLVNVSEMGIKYIK